MGNIAMLVNKNNHTNSKVYKVSTQVIYTYYTQISKGRGQGTIVFTISI